MGTKRTSTAHDRLEALARFLGIFTAPGFVFAEWHTPAADDSGIREFPYSELSKEATAFIDAAYKFGWVKSFHWASWRDSEEGKRFMAGPEQIATATEVQLAKLLTVFIRADRFCEGALADAFDAGFLTAIVRRAEALRRSEFDTG